MNKEVISDKQGIMLVALFVMGSTLVLGAGTEAKKDAWAAILLALGFAIPLVLIYARVLSLFPGKDLFDILTLVFGKYPGKSISLLFIGYALFLGGLVLRDFSDFINIVALPETPPSVPLIVFTVLCIWSVKDGIELLGRFGDIFLPVVLTIISFVSILIIPKMHVRNLEPPFYDGLKPVLTGAFHTFSFPFAETVVFLMALYSFKNRKSSYRIFLWGILLGGFEIILITARNLLVLGPDMVDLFYFPSYDAISRLNVGEFLQRVEGSVALVFIITGLVKVSICLLASCKGIAKLFSLKDYRVICVPVGIFMIELALLSSRSIIEVVDWARQIYPYFAFPFQVILPVMILIAAEIRTRLPKFRNQ